MTASDAAAAAPAGFDFERAERAITELLRAVGEDPDRDGLRDTPARVARMYAEMFSGLGRDPADVMTTSFDLAHDEMVLVRDIEIWSMCEHHLVPFFGVAHVCYIPGRDGQITGLSKLARLVDLFSHRPQVQERLTTQIADSMVSYLSPRGVIVVLEARQLCMEMRGGKKPGLIASTAARGELSAGETRREFFLRIAARDAAVAE